MIKIIFYQFYKGWTEDENEKLFLKNAAAIIKKITKRKKSRKYEKAKNTPACTLRIYQKDCVDSWNRILTVYFISNHLKINYKN